MQQTLPGYVSEQLRVEMARRGMTNTQLADLLGVNTMWVWRRARGHTEMALRDIELIAVALELPVSAFLPASRIAS